jgi:predicted metal-dependent HD superfamily phosphohydrolase
VDAAELLRWRQAWQRTFCTHCDPEIAGEVFDDLARRYSEPARYYHTLEHVRFVLRVVHQLADAPISTPLCLAVFFHDVVYDTHASDNEERSADHARRILTRLGLSPELREETARLILLTKTHQTTPDDRDGQILLDADLAILGEDEAAYDAYAAAIRREYAWVGEADYRAGRSRVLERFLARPRLYFTEAIFERAEARARANLAREIAVLRGP